MLDDRQPGLRLPAPQLRGAWPTQTKRWRAAKPARRPVFPLPRQAVERLVAATAAGGA